MKFDTVIIGGGLSGLICGIRLSQQGQRCVIISSGQSALHFSSGSFDLLNVLPDGTEVSNPLASIDELIRQAPEHPYAKLGKDKFLDMAFTAEQFFKGVNISLKGNAKQNHYRVTPMGLLKPTWLSTQGFASSNINESLPWKKVAIFNLIGFLDFYPQFIADEFLKLGTESDIHLFDLPDIEHLRRNPSELRSTNIARVLDKKISELAEILNAKSNGCDAIIFPACIGLESDALHKLEEAVEKPIFLIPTMPPSIVGIHTQQYLHDYFLKLGGVYMLGDSVKKADIEGNKVVRLYSYNHGDIPFTGKDVVLATGSYFSQGLIATSDRIYEPVFNLDVSYAPDRKEWYNTKIFESQGYQKFGVKTDRSFRGLLQGQAIDNLYVSGAILEGFNPIKEGCGAGVSILSALAIAESILSK
ncbi:MAG: glycerol-3-phosphate dehydrogenase subunit GlpB [Prevotella sp.]|jgi:glycerol-3-phosphate dehydrogenase subunit B|nr:glycerol-3-phosphate dehydrogenase subunit GlpB [Prevotella sp.]